MSDYRLWVNADRTVMVTMWASGRVEVSVRENPGQVWGPAVLVTEEAEAA